MSVLNKLDKKTLEYFNILEPNFPEWLIEYIETKEMMFQENISVSCGTSFLKQLSNVRFFSSLEHSIGVALIVWHFTRDKKQTLAGLFHDIATPAFKHCIDFLNGDYLKQESIEKLTTKIIAESDEIMALLNRDNIKLEEVNDYHIYPIADNDSPKLSADRLEYTLSNGLFSYYKIDMKTVKEIYDDITILKNEDSEIELGFKTKKYAEKFTNISVSLSYIYVCDRTRYSMQFIADVLKKLINAKKITLEELYYLEEEKIMEIMKNSKYEKIVNNWINFKKEELLISKQPVGNVYNVNIRAKIRYINPLFNGIRISKISDEIQKNIKELLNYDMDKYICIKNIPSLDKW